MSYFDAFPTVGYEFPDSVRRVIKDISIRPAVVQSFTENSENFTEYDIVEGETPETIAYDFLGDAKLHWVILLVNNILNLYSEWPKTSKQLSEFLKEKYENQVSDSDGASIKLSASQLEEILGFEGTPTNQFKSTIQLDSGDTLTIKPHHFTNTKKTLNFNYETVLAVATDAWGRPYIQPEVVPVSIFEYESEKNELKRTILLPNYRVAALMKKELRRITNG